MRGIARDLEHQQGMPVEGEPRLFDVHVEKAPVMRPAGRYHYVVDRGRQVTEELFEGSSIGGVEGRCAQHFELARCAPQALRTAPGKD